MGKKQYVVHIYTQHCREWFYICFSGLDTYRNIRSYASFVPNGVTCLCYCSHVVISISNGPEGWIWLYYTSIYFFVVYTLHKFTTAWINIYGRGRCSSDVGKWILYVWKIITSSNKRSSVVNQLFFFYRIINYIFEFGLGSSGAYAYLHDDNTFFWTDSRFKNILPLLWEFTLC